MNRWTQVVPTRDGRYLYDDGRGDPCFSVKVIYLEGGEFSEGLIPFKPERRARFQGPILTRKEEAAKRSRR